jgi:hypothetical protein
MGRPTRCVLPIVVGVLAVGLSGCALALWSPVPWLIGVALAALCALCAACGASTGVGGDADGDIDADVEIEPDADAATDACGDGRCPEYMSCTAPPEAPWCYPDADGDGVFDEDDNCPWVWNADQRDAEGDGLGDACDVCPEDNRLLDCGDPCCTDADGDGVVGEYALFGASNDRCPIIADPEQPDRDGDHIGDACDLNPDEPDMLTPCGDSGTDSDGDGLLDMPCMGEPVDACPTTPSADSGDRDGDGVPDVCDGDGVPPIAMAAPAELRRALLGRLAAEGVLDAETVRLALG